MPQRIVRTAVGMNSNQRRGAYEGMRVVGKIGHTKVADEIIL
jgi:hypothetical protein